MIVGYLYLLAALVAGLVKGFSGKKISRDVVSLNDGFTVNTIRTLFCAGIGFAVAVAQEGFCSLPFVVGVYGNPLYKLALRL